VSEPSAHKFEMHIGKVKRHKKPGIDQIPAELIKTGVDQFALRFINVSILHGIRRNCLRNGRSQSLHLYERILIKQIVVITEAYHFCQLLKKYYPTSWCQGQLHMQRKLLGIIMVNFDTAGQLQIIYSAFIKY